MSLDTRSAAEEDFIGGDLFNLRSHHLVADREQGLGFVGGGLAPTAPLGHAGRVLLAQRQQQASGDGQADAFGLGGGGEAGQLVGIEDDGMQELLLQVVALGAESVVVLGKLLPLLSVAGAVHGLDNLESVAVEGLPGDAGASGLLGDGAVGAVEDGGGVGDA